MHRNDENEGIDPAAYKLIEHIRKSRIDIRALPVWEQEVLSGYILPAKPQTIAPPPVPEPMAGRPLER